MASLNSNSEDIFMVWIQYCALHMAKKSTNMKERVCHASGALRTSQWRDKGEEKRFTQEADRDEVCRYENTGASPYTRESLIY